jgi:hypothetical protein
VTSPDFGAGKTTALCAKGQGKVFSGKFKSCSLRSDKFKSSQIKKFSNKKFSNLKILADYREVQNICGQINWRNEGLRDVLIMTSPKGAGQTSVFSGK